MPLQKNETINRYHFFLKSFNNRPLGKHIINNNNLIFHIPSFSFKFAQFDCVKGDINSSFGFKFRFVEPLKNNK